MDELPKFVAPSKNVTVPVGVPAPVVTTVVDVKVTAAPYVDGFKEETTDVLVAP